MPERHFYFTILQPVRNYGMKVKVPLVHYHNGNRVFFLEDNLNKLGQRQSQTPFSSTFWVQKDLSQKKCWVQTNFSWKKNWLQKNVGLQKSSGPNFFSSKQFCVQNILDTKSFVSKNNFVSKKLVKKIFGTNKILGPKKSFSSKNFWVQQYFGSEKNLILK